MIFHNLPFIKDLDICILVDDDTEFIIVDLEDALRYIRRATLFMCLSCSSPLLMSWSFCPICGAPAVLTIETD